MIARLLAIAAAASSAGSSDPGRPTLSVDLPAYLASADLLWSWRASAGPLDELAPVRWTQGAYLGNGLLGAMVTAVVDGASNATTALRIDVSRTDVWACSQRNPTGYLTVAAAAAAGGGALAHVDMRLELATAQLRVNLTLASGARVAFTLLVNAADPLGPTGLLALAVEGAAGGSPLGVSFTADTSGPCSDRSPASGSVPSPWGQPTSFATQRFPAGTVTAAWTVLAGSSGGGGGQQQTVLLAVANSQRSASNASASLGEALAAVAVGVAATAPRLAAASARWWAGYWSSAFFSFDSADGQPGVTALEQFVHIAGYRYASAARYTMHDLMGPWGPSHATTCIGPWCQFCWDMNQQVMLYLPTPANRGALLARPALDMLPAALNGTWAAHYGSNAPSGTDNLLWFTAQAWRYCLYHGDDARLLSAVLPALRQYLAQAALHNSSSDGRLHLRGCSSPEYPMPPGSWDDCSYGLAIYRWAAQTGLALATELAPADPGLPLFRDVAARLAPFPLDGATGSWEVAAGLPFSVPHRHYSHLLMMYDLSIVGGAPGEAAIMAASLDLWWNITCAGPQAHGPDFQGDDECRGFTQAAMAAMSSGLNRTAAALGNLTAYLRLVGLPNAMYGEEVYAGHPEQFSPVSESAYSAAASVYGMLLQSAPWPPAPQSGSAASAASGAALRLWPAAPFLNATFFRLRAQGALLVSAVRVRGETAWAAVEADVLADGSGTEAPVVFTLHCPDWEAAAALTVLTAAPPGSVVAARLQPGQFRITGLVRGAAAAFYPAGAPPPAAIAVGAAQGRNASEANWWGSRFVYKGELP